MSGHPRAAGSADDRAGSAPGLTQQEVAAALGVSRHTVIRWEQQGRLDRIPGPGRPRYDRGTVDSLVAKRADASTGPGGLRARLLACAASITAEQGAGACTVQGVAAAAGVTSGAVLHHFPHKEDLLRSLVEGFAQRFEARWAGVLETDGGRVSEAYTTATLTADEDDLSAALLVCAAEEPALLQPLAGRVRAWYRDIAVDGPAAVQRCLAADAIWLYALFGMAPVEDLGPLLTGAGRRADG